MGMACWPSVPGDANPMTPLLSALSLLNCTAVVTDNFYGIRKMHIALTEHMPGQVYIA